jgi:glutamate racemase
VLRNVRARLPREDLVYLADQAHVPYGDRPHDEIRAFLEWNIAFLDAHAVDAVVMGCNTSCAIASRSGWPPARAKILDLIDAAAQAVAESGAQRVGVIATTATAGSGAYGDAIRRRARAVAVEEIGAPALVPLVEAGTLEGPVVAAAVAEACARFHGPLDAMVLACTHFPILDAHFAAALGPSVARIDPANVQSDRAVAFVHARGANDEIGRTRFVTNGELEAFRRAVATLAGPLGPHDEVTRVEPRLS